MKNKRLVWILVMMILVVGSVAVEAGIIDSVRSATGRIGGTLGMVGGGWGILVIGVNAGIIVLLLYLITTGFKFIDLKSNTGKSVFLIALVLFSIYLSINLSVSPEGKYQFIWSKPVVSEIMRYLFNGDPAKGSIGILRPSRILILIGASLLFSWFFERVLDIGKGNHKIDRALAIIIAMEATHQGLSKWTLVFLGQIISIYLLYRQFKGEKEKFDPKSLIWAYSLVSVISNSLPGIRDQGLHWLMLISVSSWQGLIWLIIIVVFGGMIVGAVWVIAKKAEEIARWRTDIKDYAGNFIRKILRKIPIIRKAFQYRNKAPQNELPFEFKRLKLELQILMDYMLRLDVYNVKSAFVGEKLKEVEEDQKEYYVDVRDSGQQKADVWEYKVGMRTVLDPVTTRWFLKTYYIRSTGKDGQIDLRKIDPIGWANHRYLVFALMNKFQDILMEMDVETLKTENLEVEKVVFNILSAVGSGIGGYDTHLHIITESKEGAIMNKNYNRFYNGIKFYGLTQKRDSNRWAVLDQNNIAGNYAHTYLFARINEEKKTRYENVRVRIATNKFGVKFISEWRVVGQDETPALKERYGTGTKLVEVDRRGFFVEDVNRIINEEYNPNDPNREYDCRKVDPIDIVDHSSFADICSNIGAEWTYFIKDVKTGKYHPLSRTAADYNICHQKRDFYYKEMISNLREVRRSPSAQFPAFDREALKNPSIVYRGKIHFYDETENLMESEPRIKNPTISTRGLTDYIQGRVIEIEKLTSLEDKEYTKAWKFDYAKEEKKGES